MPQPPNRRKPRLDQRTKAIGGPPPSVREDALSERPPGENPNIEVETFYVDIQRSPDRVTPFAMRLLTQDLIDSLGRKRPDLVSVHLHTCVNVMAPEESDEEGTPVAPIVSNRDTWAPTNGWVPRTLFYQPAAPLNRRSAVEIASQQIDKAIGQAEEQHDDNKFIYIVGATVQLMRIKE